MNFPFKLARYYAPSYGTAVTTFKEQVVLAPIQLDVLLARLNTRFSELYLSVCHFGYSIGRVCSDN